MPGRMDEGMSSLILLAVPLFVLLGGLIELTNMARVMVAFLAALIGHVRGGLQFVLLGAMILVSGISGSKTADMAAVAPVLIPEMKKRGLDEGEMVALLAATGAMAETIPPSLVLIAIGSVTGVSIAALFTGGLLPGIVLAIGLAILARQRAGAENLAGVTRAPARIIGKTFLIALPALLLPLLIRTAVIEGVATATEVSTIGIVYIVLCGIFIYRSFPLRRLYPLLVDAATLSGAVLFIIGCANGMAWALTQSGFSRALTAAMAGIPGGQIGFLGISIVAFIILGSVLEGIPAWSCSARCSFRRPRRRHPRGPLCHGGHPRHGHRPVCAPLRPRLLRRLHHRSRESRRRPLANLALPGRSGPRPARRRRDPLDLHRLPGELME